MVTTTTTTTTNNNNNNNNNNNQSRRIRKEVLDILFPIPEQSAEEGIASKSGRSLRYDTQSKRYKFYNPDDEETDTCTVDLDDSEEVCVICLEEIGQRQGVCGACNVHYFHYDCIRNWINHDHDDCPTCRRPLWDEATYQMIEEQVIHRDTAAQHCEQHPQASAPPDHLNEEDDISTEVAGENSQTRRRKFFFAKVFLVLLLVAGGIGFIARLPSMVRSALAAPPPPPTPNPTAAPTDSTQPSAAPTISPAPTTAAPTRFFHTNPDCDALPPLSGLRSYEQCSCCPQSCSTVHSGRSLSYVQCICLCGGFVNVRSYLGSASSGYCTCE